MSVHDKIKEIEFEIARTQKNKATERHLGQLKARLSRLKLSTESSASATKSTGFEVKRSGDSRIALCGFPSVGKSTLFNLLTNNTSKVAEHAFTTVDCISGQFTLNNSVIQILDLPGIITDASKNKGRGKQVISVIRTCDLVLIVVTKPDDISLILKELDEMNIRVNKIKKKIIIEQTKTGGIQIIEQREHNKMCDETIQNEKCNEEMITSILKEFKINNCLINISEKVDDESLIDAITSRAVYINGIIVFNKVDNLSFDDIKKWSHQKYFSNDEKMNSFISSEKNWGIEHLLQVIWMKLNIIRIYTKKKGIFPDVTQPILLKNNKNTVADLCLKIHKDFVNTFKGCVVWGTSVKFPGQRVGLSHILDDEDVVQIYTS